MKILMLSWRDIKHPYGGGAEDLAHQMAKRWVKMGHKVTHFSASFPNAKKAEEIDGVTYLREGDWYYVHIKAAVNIISGKLADFDIVVDEVHGIPFFTKFYIKKPIVALACEVARDIWDQMYTFPLNIIGKLLEHFYFLTYKNIPFLTISPSAKEELIQSGIPGKMITVLPMGFSYTLPKSIPKKEKDPTVIFLGRLVKTKGIEDAIKAFEIISQKYSNAKMWIVGKGEESYVDGLKELVRNMDLEKKVVFKGFVSVEEKFKLLARAHIILVPSTHEGWGLIVPEANIVGTPAVVYNVHGLRDVTETNKNGIIIKENSPQQLASESLKLLSNKKQYDILSKSSEKYAKSMSWDDTAKASMSILEKSTKKS